MSFIVKKKKTVVSSPARSCFFLSHILAKFVINNAKYSLQKPPLLSNMLYIIGIIPIMSSFLSNKLDFLRL